MFRNQNYFGRFRIKLLGQAWEKIIVSIKRTTSFKQSELAVFLSKDINPGHIVDSPINKSRSHCQPHLDVDSLGLWIVFLSPAPLLALHLHRRRSSRHTHMLIYTWSAGPPNPVMKFRSKTCNMMLTWYDTYCMNVNTHTCRNISEVCRNVDYQHLILATVLVILCISGTWWL